MTKERYKQIIDEVVGGLDCRLDVTLEDAFPGTRLVGGKYSMKDHSITMFLEDVNEQCLRMFPGEDKAEDYFKVVFAHELGHALDEELSELADQLDAADHAQRNKLMLRIENNAWVIARRIVTDVSSVFFEEIKSSSMAPYQQAVENKEVPA
ncbi:hypothetical protein LCM10_11195 [Rossellomorea aquimaris]|uniref:hypothetical protein n=1 Tax=Rossellomorea aquimaris TaxID=189382 RepID=UPI001CD51D2D|nr:hypothetical protein [Rossellomorea aquimaris]MCA1055551.1 hypothetical protein [Rossellomorea aquimaris]